MFVRNQVRQDQLSRVAGELMAAFPGARIFAFYGKMGVGKTTFIKAFCQELGSTDVVNSPTFAIINEYLTQAGEPVFHFDFYRLKNLSEAYDLGYEDYFFTGHYCLIEWPGKIKSLLPADHVEVSITEDGDQTRSFTARRSSGDFDFS